MFEAVEDNMVTAIRDFLIIVPRIDCTANEIIILNDQFLRSFILLVRAHDSRSPGPEQVVSDKLPKGSIRFGNLSNDLVGHVPALTTAAVLLWTKDLG